MNSHDSTLYRKEEEVTHLLSDSDIISLGGAGTLGRAIAERRKREGWTGKLTVYSTDAHKHGYMKSLYPDVNFVQGDIRNPETLFNSMVGHDVCLHLAAVKVIPVSEYNSIDTIDVNVNGSLNVCQQAIAAGINHVLGISTDKACNPVNAYGATKLLMEKCFQEYARVGTNTQFHLVRYGNVLESTGSVIESWKNSIERGEPIKITDPDMTRFWLSPQQAVDLVIASLDKQSGYIYVPKMKALSIGKLALYTLSKPVMAPDPNSYGELEIAQEKQEHVRVPLRPGEKKHECLMTIEEAPNAVPRDDHWIVQPTTMPPFEYHLWEKEAYTSDIAEQLTREELVDLLKNE